MTNFNGQARRVCLMHELAGRADQIPVARTDADRADALIDDLVDLVAELRETEPYQVRERVAVIGGRVVQWLEHIDEQAAA